MRKIFGLLLLASVAAAQQHSGYRPVANNAQMMRAFIIPSSDALFNVSVEPPKNAEEWTAVENHALILAESGNLLMMSPRAKDEIWMKEARALVDAGEAAFKAAEARDAIKVAEIADQMLAICKGCHDVHLQ